MSTVTSLAPGTHWGGRSYRRKREKEELLHLYHFQIPGNGTKVKLLDMNGKEYEKRSRMPAVCHTLEAVLRYYDGTSETLWFDLR